jgi:hypothetical protein
VIFAGYLEGPRRVTLAPLAVQERMRASSLPETLSIAEKKMVAASPWDDTYRTGLFAPSGGPSALR